MSILAEIISNYDDMLADLEALRDTASDPVEQAILEKMIVDEQAARNRYYAKAVRRMTYS